MKTDKALPAAAVSRMPCELPACAAIKFPDGTQFAGRRHSDCLSMINYTFNCAPPFSKGQWAQGFMTTKGRFVNRREAFRMMHDNGIPSARPSGYRTSLMELFSEDLY